MRVIAHYERGRFPAGRIIPAVNSTPTAPHRCGPFHFDNSNSKHLCQTNLRHFGLCSWPIAPTFEAVTILEVIQRGAEFLTKKGVPSPRLQVESLLAHVLQMPRMKLYLNFERVLTTVEQLDALRPPGATSRPPGTACNTSLAPTPFCALEMAAQSARA
jgi:hypothetical protein